MALSMKAIWSWEPMEFTVKRARRCGGWLEQNICDDFDVQQERRAMMAEYQCMFGISSPIPGLDAGMIDDTFARDVFMVVASG
ncbi:hypothetical protein N7445_001296 [Penicillium cf. griseofulvum]|nr:hypothetical protein N7445_001296 [Penicillium cf. griseofulvum]